MFVHYGSPYQNSPLFRLIGNLKRDVSRPLRRNAAGFMHLNQILFKMMATYQKMTVRRKTVQSLHHHQVTHGSGQWSMFYFLLFELDLCLLVTSLRMELCFR